MTLHRTAHATSFPAGLEPPNPGIQFTGKTLGLLAQTGGEVPLDNHTSCSGQYILILRECVSLFPPYGNTVGPVYTSVLQATQSYTW